MSARILKEMGNYVGEYIEPCSRNFTGVWREYMRVRVVIDLSKPLKRRMKVRKTGGEWIWINFKYENVPTFCFICGLIGHSEKFCNSLFDKPEDEIVKPYGSWMRAPLCRQTNLVCSRWLREGSTEEEGGNSTMSMNSGETRREEQQSPYNQPTKERRENQGDNANQGKDMGGKVMNSKIGDNSAILGASDPLKKGVVIIDNKKKKDWRWAYVTVRRSGV